MRRLEFVDCDGNVDEQKKVSVDQKHAEAYHDGILGALMELAKGKAVKIKDGRSDHELKFRTASLGPVQRCGHCYVRLVLKLFREENLLTAAPDKLGDCVAKLMEFDEQVHARFPPTTRGGKKQKSIEIASYEAAKNIIKKLFDYEKFGAGQGVKFHKGDPGVAYIEWLCLPDWSAWHYIRALDVDACAYCNADAVFALCVSQKVPGKDTTFAEELAEEDNDDGSVKSTQVDGTHKRSPLDHFYGHSKYPCLGLSLYNLVPACTRCNTNMKGAKEQDAKQHVHPYRESFDDGMHFRAVFEDYASLMLSKDNPEVTLVLKEKYCADKGLPIRAKASADFFHLEEVYNQTYKHETVDVIRRIIGFPNSYWEDLRERYPGINELVLNRMLVGCSLDRKKINRERFSKMTCDLYDQLRVSTDNIMLEAALRRANGAGFGMG